MGVNTSGLDNPNASHRTKTPSSSTFPKEKLMTMDIPNVPSQGNTSRIQVFHSKNQWKAYFNASKCSDKLVVIDFTASWCGPCRSMEPTFNENADKYTDVDFIKIDVDELPDVAAEFGVHAMPTFLLMKKGDQVDKVSGARKEDLQKKIEKHE